MNAQAFLKFSFVPLLSVLLRPGLQAFLTSSKLSMFENHELVSGLLCNRVLASIPPLDGIH